MTAEDKLLELVNSNTVTIASSNEVYAVASLVTLTRLVNNWENVDDEGKLAVISTVIAGAPTQTLVTAALTAAAAFASSNKTN